MSDDALDPLHGALVEQLCNAGHIVSPTVENAFRAVRRHHFLPGIEPARAYRDEPIVTKTDARGRPISSCSQPAMIAIMLEQLGVAPGHHVLEIGAGTGYNAALLARLVSPTGSVVSIDIDPDIVDSARQHLAAAALPSVAVSCGDGARGWAARAPYDRIILTVGAGDLVPAWLDQLAPGGRLVLPLAVGSRQFSIAFEAVGDHWQSRSVRDCGFMRLRGELAVPESRHEFGRDDELALDSGDQDGCVDTDALSLALTRPAPDLPTGVRISSAELWQSLGSWLGIHGLNRGLGQLRASGASAQGGLVPALQRGPGWTATTVLVGEGSLAALVRRKPDDGSSFELAVRPFGPQGAALAEQLRHLVVSWEVCGRPSTRQLDIRACPRPGRRPDAEVVVDKQHVWLALDWLPGRPD